MSYPRRRTKPLPREELAPIGPAPSKDSPTLMRCPACLQGLVTPEVAATIEAALYAHGREEP